jgi:hypothetical protein
MKRPPTDFELLKAIYERHHEEFARYVKGAVLAGLWQQRRRDLFAVVTAAFSLAIALASLIVVWST